VGKVALFFGLRAGLLLGIAQSVLLIYQNHGPDSAFSDLTTPLSLFFWVAALLGAGYLTARQMGKISAGTLAGLWAGAIAGIFTAGTILVELIYMFGFGSLEWLITIIASYLTGLILFILFTMGAGTGLGALGGLIGQSFFSKTPTPPQPQYQQQRISSQLKEPPQQ
jgi:hypothetical protein